jgi:hypothetical protein
MSGFCKRDRVPAHRPHLTRDHLDVLLVDDALVDEVHATVALIVLANERPHLTQAEIDQVLLQL